MAKCINKLMGFHPAHKDMQMCVSVPGLHSNLKPSVEIYTGPSNVWICDRIVILILIISVKKIL